jgi:hypothetical protein
MSEWTDVAQAVGSIISAVASVVLVVVAFLFREEVRSARLRPVLGVSHRRNEDGELMFYDPTPNFWIVLHVGNAIGKDTARGVQLSVVRVVPRPGTEPLRLPVPARPLQDADTHQTQIDVGPNVERRFTLAFVDHESFGAELDMRPRSVAQRDVLPPGSYCVYLALTADNADASYWSIDLTLVTVPSLEANFPELLRVGDPVRLVVRP